MLGDSAALGGGGGGGAGDAVPSSAGTTTHEAVASGGGGGAGSNSGDDERGRIIDDGERSFGGNRWPRQETLALLRIRSDMDVAFRDASVKGPLWEEVSRKMAELGYHRSSKKCKEKFENVYKYHKRTKEGRSGKPDGKTYRFFDQLEALENHPPTHHHQLSPNPSKPQPQLVSVIAREGISTLSVTTSAQPISSVPTTTPTMPQVPPPVVPNNVTVPSTTTATITTTQPSMPQGIVITPSINIPIIPPSYPQPTNPTNFQPPPSSTANPTVSFPNFSADLLSNSSSSSTSSEETTDGRRKRKRKWKDFFERLMKEVIDKQEDLQRRFLDAVEKRERDRMAREEAWRVQEMQRINREREILAQERSIAAAKDAAVMSFLQKIAEQQNLGQTLNNIDIVIQPQQQPQQQQQPQPKQQSVSVPQTNVAPTPTPIVVTASPAPVPAVVTNAAPVAQVQQPRPPPVVQPIVVPQQQVTSMEMVMKADNNGENLTPASSSRWPKVEVQALIQLRTNMDAKYQENGPKGPLWEEISAAMRKLGYNRNAKRCKEKWENINKYFKKVKESNKKRPEDSKTCPYFHQLDALYREKNKMEAKPPESMVAPLMVRPEQQWPPQQENDHMDEDDEEDKEGEEDDEDEDEGGGGGNYEVVPSKPPVGASAE